MDNNEETNDDLNGNRRLRRRLQFEDLDNTQPHTNEPNNNVRPSVRRRLIFEEDETQTESPSPIIEKVSIIHELYELNILKEVNDLEKYQLKKNKILEIIKNQNFIINTDVKGNKHYIQEKHTIK
jgi:hypothetical protein